MDLVGVLVEDPLAGLASPKAVDRMEVGEVLMDLEKVQEALAAVSLPARESAARVEGAVRVLREAAWARAWAGRREGRRAYSEQGDELGRASLVHLEYLEWRGAGSLQE